MTTPTPVCFECPGTALDYFSGPWATSSTETTVIFWAPYFSEAAKAVYPCLDLKTKKPDQRTRIPGVGVWGVRRSCWDGLQHVTSAESDHLARRALRGHIEEPSRTE
jgi:hypothetical protein